MPESLLMFTVSIDWLLHAIAKRINTEIIDIFINITTYGLIPGHSNDILDRRIRPTAFFWMLQSPSSISLFLLPSFYAQSNISILWLFSLICMATAAGAAFLSWEKYTVKI